MNSIYIKNIITENNIITYSMQENNANVVAIESSFEFILIIVNKYGHCLGY